MIDNNMITWDRFLALVTDPDLLNRMIDQDRAQESAIQAGVNQSLFIVAGPGSGKTTVLSLRVLKLILVDSITPNQILATTFTRKAAAELRSRILGWGDRLRRVLLEAESENTALVDQLERLDFNQVITGTLDSIAQQVLGDYRDPGTQPPILLEEFVAKAMMARSGLWVADENGQLRSRNQDLQTYVRALSADTRTPNLATMIDICMTMRDRILHDQVDIDALEEALANAHPGVVGLCAAVKDYESRLEEDLVTDYSALEAEFLARLDSGLDRFTQNLKVVLVDEYQDTNLLQEQIYFTLAQAANRNDGSITVVGDDDQSLYRFRGATVELFRDLHRRLLAQCGVTAVTIYLNRNYRSTNRIVEFFNDFVALDPPFESSRVAGKPMLTASRFGDYEDFPILGLFRPDRDSLASEIARFLQAVFFEEGYSVPVGAREYTIIRDRDRGSIGDCAILCSSAREYSSSHVPRLPLLLRNQLALMDPSVEVFNPRGQEFSEIQSVERICGLMLECIDPDARVQQSIANFPGAVPDILNRWRRTARRFVESNPSVPGTTAGGSLPRFVRQWQERRLPSGNWPQEVTLMSLLYNLVTWIPNMQEDAEGLVYLEVITRTIAQSARFISYGSSIRRDEPHATRSVTAILRGVFEQLASGAIDIDEGLIETFPRDRLNILTIHQAKGLEFPMAIVDVGSDFGGNHWKQAFKRFPREGGRPHILEDAVRPFSPLGRPNRSALDRAFDDLVRHYYVAFSRAQDVLVLVGLGDEQDGPLPRVPNVATGWTRSGEWSWEGMPSVTLI